MIFYALLGIYLGHIGYCVFMTQHKRKSLKSGDYCNIYIGEQKFRVLVLKVNQEVDVWVLNMIVRFAKKEIYA